MGRGSTDNQQAKLASGDPLPVRTPTDETRGVGVIQPAQQRRRFILDSRPPSPSTMKPLLLALIHLSDAHRTDISDRFELVFAPKPDLRVQAIRDHAPKVRAVLTNGTTGL